MKAIFNGQIIAESDHTEVVEGNHYFPPNALKKVYLKQSNTRIANPNKGEALYYDIEVEGKQSHDVAWYFPDPKDAALHIKDHVAFDTNKIEIIE